MTLRNHPHGKGHGFYYLQYVTCKDKGDNTLKMMLQNNTEGKHKIKTAYRNKSIKAIASTSTIFEDTNTVLSYI